MLCKIVLHICNNAPTFNPTKIRTTNPISVPADNAITAQTYTPTNRLSYPHHQIVTKYQRKLQHLLSITIKYDNRLRPIRIYDCINLLRLKKFYIVIFMSVWILSDLCFWYNLHTSQQQQTIQTLNNSTHTIRKLKSEGNKIIKYCNTGRLAISL